MPIRSCALSPQTPAHKTPSAPSPRPQQLPRAKPARRRDLPSHLDGVDRVFEHNWDLPHPGVEPLPPPATDVPAAPTQVQVQVQMLWVSAFGYRTDVHYPFDTCISFDDDGSADESRLGGRLAPR